ncbi:MAG: bifunctional phosphopantothenoylcysteine decarboxylase/phosphopantothenate--cysteine ligase CoaBC [Denitrovibrio sp.]|mgnify:CR=1 FL=1|nr:MAG: bifunctional phosphopantothenoylcysteine decarboxylase/phosphopantothenate--cysteine ligase CoaBC [Denitrovibrio sp.]
MPNYLIGVTGGIACYKTITLCRLLMKAGHDVRVIMTDNACKFVTPLTFETITRNRAYVDEFDAGLAPDIIEHIDLANWADEFVIAPATANSMAKIANGIADNLLTSTVLVYKKPIVFSPAMNVDMYANVATQTNLKRLAEMGHQIIEPGVGEMACQAEGKGRMAEPEEIFQMLCGDMPLEGVNILVTAGPTVEPIDPVRYISNRSSGKMGVAIAKKAMAMGANVKVVAGPVSVSLEGLNCVSVQTADEMLAAVKADLSKVNILIMAAAVADYKVSEYSDKKIKKNSENMSIELEKNPDILKTIASDKDVKQVFVGFAAESNDVRENALKKLDAKNLDFIVANDISREDIGFETDQNEVSIYFSDGTTTESGKIEKSKVAELILSNALKLYKAKNGTV